MQSVECRILLCIPHSALFFINPHFVKNTYGEKMNYIEYKKEISHKGHYDVVVIGGGPSGVCAAIESARAGKRTLLVEAYGMLGGMATTSLVSPFMTVYDRDGDELTVGGLYREIVDRLKDFSAVIPPEETDSPSVHTSFIEKYHRHVTPFLPFYLQIVLDDMVRESGVEVLLYTRFADCICQDGKIKSAILCALEGLISVSADVFIDCSGNADVAAAAGVDTYKGDEESGIPQPGTLMFEVGGVDQAAYEAYGQRPPRPVKAYRTPVEDRYAVNHFRVFDVDATNSESMTRGHMEARRQVLDALRVLHEETPGFENAEILQVASVLGVRESRHIRGKYKITVADVSCGTKFDDRIAVYGFGMDVHLRNADITGNFKIEVAKKYYIPYSSMLPEGCDNLIVAGKTVSCESQAAGGLRCMPAAMAMGQAAGLAAAMTIDCGDSPSEIDVSDLQATLRAHGAILD